MYTTQAERLKDAAAELKVPVAVLLAHIVDAWLFDRDGDQGIEQRPRL